ncbi:MAG: DUF4380 domain-containing protein [Bacteroidetes bacterium]|nr:DUF4380 domain-containing protein [Bacteroidota bacterium]
MNSADCAAQLKQGWDLNKVGYSVSSGDVCITVDPRVGARIISLKLGRYEFISGPDVMQGNYGSTFWPSPQSDWSWPPAVLDSEPYSATTEGDTLQFTSSGDARTGLQVVKKIFPGKMGWLNLVYSMKNITDSVRKVAPWEITRIRKGGLLFFSVGHNPLGGKSFDQAPARIIDGVAWYKDKKQRPANNLLTTADGTEGWAAYAIDGRLFLKKFPNISPDMLAPHEGEITFYVSKEADYVEFEVQGKYESLEPGRSSTWQVQWIVVNIPGEVVIGEGSRALVDYARKLAR